LELIKSSSPSSSKASCVLGLLGGAKQNNHHKHRHETFILANQETKKIYSEDILYHIRNLAKEYINDVKDKKVVLVNEKENKVLILDYFTRFSKKYAKRTYAKLNAIAEDFENFNNKNAKATLITLTINQENYFTLDYAYKNLRKEQHKLTTAIKKHYGKDILGYIFVPELGKKNKRLHGHLLIFHNNTWISAEKIRKNYKIGNIDLKQIRRFRHITYGIKYILKYITKYHFAEDNVEQSEGLLSLSVFWSLNGRCYSHSRFSLVSLDKHRTIETDWSYFGSFDLSILDLKAGIYPYDEIYPKLLEIMT
jgi:hypothetical protein